MVELRGRGDIRVEIHIRPNQRRPCLDTGRPQQRGKQRVLVLAVSVLVRENFLRRVGSISAGAEGRESRLSIKNYPSLPEFPYPYRAEYPQFPPTAFLTNGPTNPPGRQIR